MSAIVFEARVTADHELHFTLPDQVPTGSTIKVTVEPVESVVHDELVDNYQPRTELGRKLIELRRAYLQNGGKLMTQQEIIEYVRRNRGELDND